MCGPNRFHGLRLSSLHSPDLSRSRAEQLNPMSDLGGSRRSKGVEGRNPRRQNRREEKQRKATKGDEEAFVSQVELPARMGTDEEHSGPDRGRTVVSDRIGRGQPRDQIFRFSPGG